MLIAPSILDADFTILGEVVKELEQADADWLHLDIMDGQFVPQITFGQAMVKALRVNSQTFFDCHLMITNPEAQIAAFVNAGADQLTVHVEACQDIYKAIQTIKDHGIKAGVALNPGTSIKDIEFVLPLVDLVLQMTVCPGKGGQAFIQETMSKVDELVVMRQKHNLNFLIQVDGGINQETAQICRNHQVDVIVAGSYLFNKQEQGVATAISSLR